MRGCLLLTAHLVRSAFGVLVVLGGGAALSVEDPLRFVCTEHRSIVLVAFDDICGETRIEFLHRPRTLVHEGTVAVSDPYWIEDIGRGKPKRCSGFSDGVVGGFPSHAPRSEATPCGGIRPGVSFERRCICGSKEVEREVVKGSRMLRQTKGAYTGSLCLGREVYHVDPA